MKKSKNKDATYWIYGIHPVIAALNNPKRQKKELVISKSSFEEIEKLIDINSLKVNYRIIDVRELKLLFDDREVNHQGIALKTAPLASLDIQDLLDIVKNKIRSLVIALDQITDPQNLGSIIRSAAAFNVDGIIITKNNSASETAVVVKASSGGIDLVNLIYVNNLSRTLEELRKNNFWIIGLDGGEEVINSIDEAREFEKVVLIFGSEGGGMRRLTKETCDLSVKIPINRVMDSLNVSNAAAIAMHALSEANTINCGLQKKL
jgi:23S rRNA (guanosine2251-2'-O)-methyltransferase